MALGSFWRHGARVTEREDTAEWERVFKVLYFVHSPDAKRVKVGVSGRVRERVWGFRNVWGADESKPILIIPSYHLWLFGALEAREVEQRILSAFGSCRLNGEWLSLTPEVEELERWLEGVADIRTADDCEQAMTALARGIGWPMERFRFKRNETGEMLVESGERLRGQGPQYRRWSYTPSRGKSLKV